MHSISQSFYRWIASGQRGVSDRTRGVWVYVLEGCVSLRGSPMTKGVMCGTTNYIGASIDSCAFNLALASPAPQLGLSTDINVVKYYSLVSWCSFMPAL